MNPNAAQIHLLLNHVPVIGSVGVLIVLVVALIRKSEEFTRLALGLALLVALVTIPVFRTGEPAEKRVEHMPGVTEHFIHEHEEMATFAFGAMLLLGVFSAFVIGTSRGKRLAGWVTPGALVLTLVVSGLMAVTAHRGGMIRHTEIRPDAVAPVATAGAGEAGATVRDSTAPAPGESGEKDEADAQNEAGERH